MRTAARTVGAASGPTDAPVSTVSLARSAREVRARPPFYVDTERYDSPPSSFPPSSYRYERASTLTKIAFYRAFWESTQDLIGQEMEAKQSGLDGSLFINTLMLRKISNQGGFDVAPQCSSYQSRHTPLVHYFSAR